MYYSPFPISIVCVLAGAGQLGAQEREPANHPGQMFRAQCAVCHTVPDTAFATDRAWLEQVKVTA